MQTHVESNPNAVLFVFPIFLVAFWCTISFLTGRISGWAALANRFRLTFPFPSQTWSWKSANALGCELQSVPDNWGRPHRTLPLGAFLLSSWSSAAVLAGQRFPSAGAGSCFLNTSNLDWVGRSRFPFDSGKLCRPDSRRGGFQLARRGCLLYRLVPAKI
jgi:hypothetical protein